MESPEVVATVIGLLAVLVPVGMWLARLDQRVKHLEEGKNKGRGSK